MKATAIATVLLIGLTTAIGFASSSRAQDVCPVDAARAVDEAREILRQGDQNRFGVALACVTLALAETRAELEGLREGRVAFRGQVNAPKGLMISKPSVQEGR